MVLHEIAKAVPHATDCMSRIPTTGGAAKIGPCDCWVDALIARLTPVVEAAILQQRDAIAEYVAEEYAYEMSKWRGGLNMNDGKDGFRRIAQAIKATFPREPRS